MQEGKEEKCLKLDNLSVGYDGKTLLSELNLLLKRGSVLTLIGPNGSGKSTILKTITGHLSKLGGTVYIGKEDVESLPAKELAKNLSMVSTERISPELMTCYDVIASGRYPYTGYFGKLGEEDKEVIEEAIEILSVTELRNLLFTKISDGQRQRVMLARALCQQPDFLILDEPTSYLDMHFKLEILSAIRDLCVKKNIAVLMSLHEIDLAQKISDQIALVDGNTISYLGDPGGLFDSDDIYRIYDIKKENYNHALGILQLKKIEGKPYVFVISGGGSGIPLYYELQRKQIPFAAGILQKNDGEYAVAEALATEVVFSETFYPMTEEHLNRAKKLLDQCAYCICTLDSFGPLNEKNKELLSYAKETGKLVEKI